MYSLLYYIYDQLWWEELIKLISLGKPSLFTSYWPDFMSCSLIGCLSLYLFWLFLSFFGSLDGCFWSCSACKASCEPSLGFFGYSWYSRLTFYLPTVSGSWNLVISRSSTRKLIYWFDGWEIFSNFMDNIYGTLVLILVLLHGEAKNKVGLPRWQIVPH